MPTYAVRAVVLRTLKLGESDRIVTLFAADGRQLRAVAKGSRKGTSRLAGRMQPYAVSDLLLATGRSLDVVQEAETVASHEAVRGDLDRSLAAAAIAELAERLSVEGDPEPRVFDLTVASLDALDTAGPGEPTTLVASYYAKSLAMHGWRPQLLTCTACGAEAPAGWLSPAQGGVLCTACAGADPSAWRLDVDAQVLLRVLLGATIEDILASEPDPGLVRDDLVLLREFAVWHLGSRLRAVEVLLGAPPASIGPGPE